MNDVIEVEYIVETDENSRLARLREQAAIASREFVRLFQTTMEVMVLLAAIALPWLWRGMTVVVDVMGIVRAFPAMYHGFGHDGPAVLPSLAMSLLPTAGALGVAAEMRVEPWGAFLAAGVLTFLMGTAARAASPISLALAVGAVMAGIVVHFTFTHDIMEGEEESP